MRRFIFRIPAEYRPLVKGKIAEIHHQRLGIVVPIMALVGMLFVFLDIGMVDLERGPSLAWIYLALDVGLCVGHAIFYFWLLRRRTTTPNGVVYGYMTFVLAWAVVTANIEFQRSGNFTTMFLALLSVGALGLFSVRGILCLMTVTFGCYLGLNILWPGPAVQGLDRYAALLALPFLTFAVSRTLYAAVVRNLIATFELERSNQQLKEARLNLVRQEKLASLGVLSAGIAHEINNPLAFIKSNVSALERNSAALGGDPALQAENQVIFAETKEGFRRISEVVQALGAFARDLPPGQWAPYDLNEGVRTTLVMTRHETFDVVIDTDLAPLPPVQARGSEVNQVLLNLVMNAIQAVRGLPPGQVRLVMVRTRAERDSVVAEVSNTGPPVPPELKEKIFEPFFSTKAPGAGMGLGLSLSWQIIVHRHGGDLELVEGEPVTFRIRLPLGPPDQSATQSTK